MRPVLLIGFLLLPLVAFSQLDNSSSSVKFEAKEDNFRNPQGLSLPAKEQPSMTIPRDNLDPQQFEWKEEEEPLDMTKDDGLLSNTTKDFTPKYFTKDKEASEEYGRDQDLGEYTTGSAFVKVMYRDHEYVDGDQIRIYVNGDVVQSRVHLNSGFSGIAISLDEGMNVIEFEALNQGESGPNTAELHVYNDEGQIISAKEWNLLTGYKAVVRVLKE